ncbi:MAG TPA: hypothetical protein VJ731_06210 [Terriglobales bacterium]|nr:hypothetical protein [Terriglobales bacterium]
MLSRRNSSHLRTTFVVLTSGALVILFGAFVVGLQQADLRSDQDKDAYYKAMLEADQKISALEKIRPEVMHNEEYLTTYIGPRLTGSPAMQKASHWALDLFRKYGLEAHLESSQIPHAWYRGNDWGKVVSPIEHWMTVRSAAWSKATPGPVIGSLVAVDENTKPEDISSNPTKYKGAIVLAANWPPCSVQLPQNPANAYDAVVTPADRDILRAILQGGAGAAAIMQRLQELGKVMAALATASERRYCAIVACQTRCFTWAPPLRINLPLFPSRMYRTLTMNGCSAWPTLAKERLRLILKEIQPRTRFRSQTLLLKSREARSRMNR